jgi:hypothetical protein
MLTSAIRRALRPLWSSVLALATIVTVSTPLTTRASAEEESVARIQMIIHRIVIHDDQDWGRGEFELTARVWEVVDGCPPDVHPDVPEYYPGCTRILTQGRYEASVTDGSVLRPDRTIPSSGDVIGDPSVAPAFGIPIIPNRNYGWSISAVEIDTAVDDGMGHLAGSLNLNKDNRWSILGKAHFERGMVGWSSMIPPGFGHKPAHYSVEYEFRQVPLPDLEPTVIKRPDLAGDNDPICVGFLNRGTQDAGPFEVAIYVDGSQTPAGTARAGGLAAPGGGEVCINASLPAGEHRLTVVVDGPETVFEENETNNRFSEAVVVSRAQAGAVTAPRGSVVSGIAGIESGSPFAAAAADEPTPSQQARADLTVEAVRVRGNQPSGQNDCDPGNNEITVVVKNQGTAGAANFFVRLLADDETTDQSVSQLAAGQVIEVRFTAVELQRGARKIGATVDAGSSVNEASESNNERSVSVQCQND